MIATNGVPDPRPGGPPARRPLLAIEDLSLTLRTEHGPAHVLDQISVNVDANEVLGIVGESGSGKSLTALTTLGLVPRRLIQKVGGTIELDGRRVPARATKQLATFRGSGIAMIFQEPLRSLDPAFSVGSQIAEAARRHAHLSRREAWKRAVEALDRVHIARAADRAHDYPRSFSGGMRQRIMISLALACRPRILIADEPTTALDVTEQARILNLLKEIQADTGLGIIFIAHDLAVIAEISDRVTVMYGGQIAEVGTCLELFQQPKHPYTERLLNSIPQRRRRGDRFDAIPGSVPAPFDWPDGCRFHPRCDFASHHCRAEPVVLRSVATDRVVRCVHPEAFLSDRSGAAT